MQVHSIGRMETAELPKILLIIYYSKTGKTEKMASNIARGAEKEGVNAISKKVTDCTLNDLALADGIVVGSPTHYSNIAWQVKRLMDETILTFYTEGHSLRGKVCGCFTSTGAYDDGKECIRMLELAFGFALKMKMVPGIILETKDVEEGNLATCYEYGQKIAKELAV
jgi:NAD(P)H dehydrogenase (quinone)